MCAHETDRRGHSLISDNGDRANAYTEPNGATARDMLINLLTSEVQDDPVVRTNSAAWGELHDTAIFDELLRPTLTALTDRWVNDIVDMVKAGHLDGAIDTHVEPASAGVRLSALVEGLSSRWLAGLLTTPKPVAMSLSRPALFSARTKRSSLTRPLEWLTTKE